VNCYHFCSEVSITLKTKIRYNGKEYSSPAELPPEVRAAYENALHGKAAGFNGAVVKKRFFINGQSFSNEEEMPADVRKLCDDVMGVIENNGEVTLPENKSEPLLSKREIGIVALFAGGIIALVAARIIAG